MAIEIVDFPIKNGDFPLLCLVHQRVWGILFFFCSPQFIGIYWATTKTSPILRCDHNTVGIIDHIDHDHPEDMGKKQRINLGKSKQFTNLKSWAILGWLLLLTMIPGFGRSEVIIICPNKTDIKPSKHRKTFADPLQASAWGTPLEPLRISEKPCRLLASTWQLSKDFHLYLGPRIGSNLTQR